MAEEPVASKKTCRKICTNQCGVVIDVAGDHIPAARRTSYCIPTMLQRMA